MGNIDLINCKKFKKFGAVSEQNSASSVMLCSLSRQNRFREKFGERTAPRSVGRSPHSNKKLFADFKHELHYILTTIFDEKAAQNLKVLRLSFFD